MSKLDILVCSLIDHYFFLVIYYLIVTRTNFMSHDGRLFMYVKLPWVGINSLTLYMN
jgi:hypothetical protein